MLYIILRVGVLLIVVGVLGPCGWGTFQRGWGTWRIVVGVLDGTWLGYFSRTRRVLEKL